MRFAASVKKSDSIPVMFGFADIDVTVTNATSVDTTDVLRKFPQRC